MIYIFSNVYKFSSDEKFVRKLNDTFKNKKDIYFHLNKCIPFHHGYEFFKDKKNYALINSPSRLSLDIVKDNKDKLNDDNFTFGYADLLKNNKIKSFKDVFLYGNQIFSIFNFINLPWYDAPVSYKKDGEHKFPTTGYHAYFLARDFFCTDEVTLVNFYGSKDNSTDKWQGHNWNFEEETYKKINARKIFLEES